jgi:CRISPR-associated protein Csd1
VFGPLLRGLRHHVADALKQGRGGWIDGKVGEIIAKLPPNLPPTLRLEDQGRFAIGYYHERAFRRSSADEFDPSEEEASQ